MTRTQAQILELMQTLSPTEREELWSMHLIGPSFYEQMTAEQRAQLNEGIAQAQSGEGREASEVFADLRRKFNFSTA